MKTLKITLLCASVVAFLTTTQAQSWLTNGLVAYYPFNGNANDASGNGNDGDPGTAQITPDRFGNENGAYYFNGTNASIGFATVPTTNVNELSMFCWVKPSVVPQIGMALKLGDSSSGQICNGFALGIGRLNANGTVDGCSDCMGTRLVAENACVAWVDGGFDFQSTNDWHHLGLVRDAGFDKFYVDGKLTSAVSKNAPHNPTRFTIGAFLVSGIQNSYFTGFIDDVRVYNRTLSSTEVAKLYFHEAGLIVNVKKAVYLDSEILQVGSEYQIQISSDLVNWANYGDVFLATSPSWRTTNYWDVENWGNLFFRLKVAP